MTIQNAIDYFKNYIEFCKNDEAGAPTLEPFEIAVEAMEMQIPRKPYIDQIEVYGEKSDCYKCSNCDMFVGYVTDCRYYEKYGGNCCPNCGQAIMWESD